VGCGGDTGRFRWITRSLGAAVLWIWASTAVTALRLSLKKEEEKYASMRE